MAAVEGNRHDRRREASRARILEAALHLFRASALLELGMQSTDGTGATLAWPLVKSAAALLTEVAEGEDPGPSRPSFTQSLSGVTSPGLLGAK